MWGHGLWGRVLGAAAQASCRCCSSGPLLVGGPPVEFLLLCTLTSWLSGSQAHSKLETVNQKGVEGLLEAGIPKVSRSESWQPDSRGVDSKLVKHKTTLTRYKSSKIANKLGPFGA